MNSMLPKSPDLHVATASEWKTIILFVGQRSVPLKASRTTFEPYPSMRINVDDYLHEIVDIDERIDGGFNVYAIPVRNSSGLAVPLFII